jgi:hypothetical protein
MNDKLLDDRLRALAGSAGKRSLKGSNFRGKALYRHAFRELQ